MRGEVAHDTKTHTVHKFTKDEVSVLMAVANQAAMAIENAELMVRTKVIQEELETRKQILIYTVELVVITLLGPLVGIGGWLYLVAAGVMGVGLTYLAWLLWRTYTPKLAWKMYRYSSMYLAFLFLFMVVDAVL